MKPRHMRAVAMAVALAALMVSANTSTVSANADSFARESSSGSHSTAHDDTNAGSSSSHTLVPDLCVGLPRDTVLASCPAPCLPDAACIVYDQDPDATSLTGCDYGTANSESLCSSAGGQAQTCELQCFARLENNALFEFAVNVMADDLGEPQRRNSDASVLDTPMAGPPFQSNDFVRAVGPLQVSETIKEISIAGMYDRGSADRVVDVILDRTLLTSAAAVTTLRLANLPLAIQTLTGVLAHAPPSLTTLVLARTKLTTLPATVFAHTPQLEMLSLTDNAVSFAYPTSLQLPNLKQLYLDSNGIEFFDAVTPRLEALDLVNNKLLCIPSSVYSFRLLQSLNMAKNRLLRPLVLTQDQVAFLEALPDLTLELVDPPYPELVTALPTNDRGIESDAINISKYLVDATPGSLRRDPDLQVLVVSSENAQRYNSIVEARASLFDTIPTPTSDPTEPATTLPSLHPFLPDNVCMGIPRNTLTDNCLSGCPYNGACVVYDQDAELNEPSACDYNVSSSDSYCTNASGTAKMCEFHCFAAFLPDKVATEFRFLVTFETDLGDRVQRNPDKYVKGGSMLTFKTDEVPFLSNRFVDAIGPLTLRPPISSVWISGGRTDDATRGRVADVAVSSSLLSQVPTVTSLALVSISFRDKNVAAVLASAPPTLKSLNLRNTMTTQLPAKAFGQLQKLETLILAQNDMADFSAQLPELQSLDLSENYLSNVDFTAPQLTTLDLRGNNFARIPPTVFAMSSLRSLNLLDNPIAVPLVVSPSQLSFVRKLESLQLPTTPTLPTTANPNGSGTSVGANGTAVVIGVDGSLVLVTGTAAVVNGVSVIVVDNETNVEKYNDVLQQKQPSATPSPESRSMGGVGSTSSKTSSNQTMLGTDGTVSSSPSSPSGASGVSSSNTSDVNSSNTSKAASTSRSLVAVVAVGGLGSAFFVGLVFLFIARKSTGRRAKALSGAETYVAMDDSAGRGSGSSSSVVSWWTDDDMLSHRLGSGDISDVRVIGGTGSGLIWLVNYRTGSQQLVSKRLIHGEGAAYDDKVLELIAEAKLASQLHHPSVVPFVGVAWSDKTDLQVLYAYMSNGSLSSYLARTDPSSLPWHPEKLQLAIDIIEALVYTHSFNPPLVHRDLKSSNVLLDDDFKAKLGDFGCARVESESNTMTANEIGTGRWLAPEILLGSTSYGSSSDIYSFGVVLCELDTHQVPYAEQAQGMSEATLLQRVARGELRPSVSASCPPEIERIAAQCMAFDADARPNAMQVAFMLRSWMPREDEDSTMG